MSVRKERMIYEMSETLSMTPQLEEVLLTALRETREWEWDGDDRKWATCGAVLKYLEAQPDFVRDVGTIPLIEATVQPYLDREQQREKEGEGDKR